MRFDLREFELGVVRIHFFDLLSGGRAQDLDDLHQLIHSGISGENGLSEHQLGKDTSGTPNINVGSVVSGAKDQFGRPVIPGADIGHVGLPSDQMLGAAKVTQLEDSRFRVEQQVLRLDVSVTNALRVNVGQTAEQLVHVQLDEHDGNALLALGVLSGHLVDGLGDVFQHEIEVNLVLLLARRVEEILELDNVAMLQTPHDLQLSVLEPFVLQHLLDGHHFARVAQLGLVNHAETTIADHLKGKERQNFE